MNKLRSRLEVNLGALLLLVLLAGCLLVLRPFVSALLWAVVLCFSSWPIYRRLLGWLGNRRTLAALALSIFIAFFLFRDGVSAGERLTTGVERLAGERGRHLLIVAGNTVRGVVYGILGTALAQAVVAGIGFVIAGVPGVSLLAL